MSTVSASTASSASASVCGVWRSVFGAASASPTCGSPQSAPSTTPSRAAFSVAAAARYGLAVAHGMRFSIRVAGPRSAGTRYVLKRLSRPQFAQYPAISPGISRL